MSAVATGFDFELSDDLAAHEPPEARGLGRDGVRLMVSHVAEDKISHTRFTSFPDFLKPGDLLVVNASATLNAAFQAVRVARDGGRSHVLLHLSAPLSRRRWVVELRHESDQENAPLFDASAGDSLLLAAGASTRLVEPYAPGADVMAGGRVRLWVAEVSLPTSAEEFAALHGSPIRYGYVPNPWPLSYYQTLFSREPGSAEMASAGRAFTPRVVERLTARGVRIAPIVLHTGVSSLEADERPYPERYRVSAATARAVNAARASGGRIVAVGTTSVRALETVATRSGEVCAGHGWTNLVVGPERGLRSVDALLTGLHAPHASHLSLLEAIAGPEHLARAYHAALAERYLWHEFGDLHLILP